MFVFPSVLIMQLFILMAIFLCETVVSDDFLKIEFDGQLEWRYGNNSDDISMEISQKKLKQQRWDIGEPSNYNESNDIPSGLLERDFQKYNRLLHKLKFGKVINDVQGVPIDIGSVPTTEKTTTSQVTTEKMTNKQVQTTPTTPSFNQPLRREFFSEEMTDVDKDYDIIIMDKTQQFQPIRAPSGVGFFRGFLNFVRLLITASAIVEADPYEED